MKMGLFGKNKENKEEAVKAKCSCGKTAADTVQEEMLRIVGKAGLKTGDVLTIKILGSGCKNCQTLLQNTKDAVSAMSDPAKIEYITDMKEIAKYGVMRMPALLVGEQVVSMGKVLKASDIQKLLNKLGLA